MCTMIASKTAIEGAAKGPNGWFDVDHAYVGYDHPYQLPLEHALTLDFVNESADGPATRVAVELPLAAARRLAEQLLAALDAADRYESAAPAGHA